MIDLRKHITMNTQNRNGSVLLKVLIAIGILFLLFLFLSPAFRSAREPARRSSCKNNLRQIGIALHNYHKIYHSFPPAYTVDEQGTRLHSWRTLILPFLEQQELYDSMDLTKPWDNPANAHALEKRLVCYQCPSADIDQLKTIYLGIAAEGGNFASSEPVSFKQITDDISRTLAVTEVPLEHAVHWMQPTDADENVLNSIQPQAEVAHRGGIQALLIDGFALIISLDTDKNNFKGMWTYAGGEEIGEI